MTAVNLILGAMVIIGTILVASFIIGRPPTQMSEYRRALRALRALHREEGS